MQCPGNGNRPGSGPSNGSIEGSIRWWDSKYKNSDGRADACFRWLTRVINRQSIRRRMHILNMRLYEDQPALGLGPYCFSTVDTGDDTLRINLVRAVINTWVPLIGRSKPKPRILTSDGTWEQQKQARGMTRWLGGKIDELNVYRDASTPCLRDAAVFGMGIAQVYQSNPSSPKITDAAVDRAFPWEMVADEMEAQNPKYLRTLARRRLMDRQQAADTFPKARDYILHKAPRYGPGSVTYDYAVDTASDLIAIAEFWRLPNDDGEGGLHVICCPGKLLYEEEWDIPRFPMKFLYRERPTQGVWGVSMPSLLRGMQTHINTSLLDIEECLRLYGKPKWMFPVGSVDKNFLSDEIDDAIPYTGQVPPTVYSPAVMPAEVYNFLWQVWQKGFEMFGITVERAGGNIPAGLSGSGASIREWNDVEDGRHYEPSDNFEEWHMQLAEELIEVARSVNDTRKKAKLPAYTTVVRGTTTVQLIDFSEVDLGKEHSYMGMFPVSRLATAPAQRLAQLQDLFNAGQIDGETFRDLLDFPDINGEDNLMNAPRELTKKLIERFLDADDPTEAGVFVYPEPEWPLAQMRVRFQYAEVRARLDGAPEGNCKLLRQFIKLCDVALKPPAPMGPPGAPPGGPQGPGPVQPAQPPQLVAPGINAGLPAGPIQ